MFRIRSDDDGDELAFLITCRVNEEDRAAGIENVSVWIEAGDCWAVQVTDRSGNVIECGHHRPEEIHTKWAAATDEARRRMTERQALRNS